MTVFISQTDKNPSQMFFLFTLVKVKLNQKKSGSNAQTFSVPNDSVLKRVTQDNQRTLTTLGSTLY